MVRFESGGNRAVFCHEDCLTVWSAETGAAITGWVTQSKITAVGFAEGWIVAGLVSGEVLIFELVEAMARPATSWNLLTRPDSPDVESQPPRTW